MRLCDTTLVQISGSRFPASHPSCSLPPSSHDACPFHHTHARNIPLKKLEEQNCLSSLSKIKQAEQLLVVSITIYTWQACTNAIRSGFECFVFFTCSSVCLSYASFAEMYRETDPTDRDFTNDQSTAFVNFFFTTRTMNFKFPSGRKWRLG